MEEVNYKIDTGLSSRDLPYIFVDMSYKDSFTNDNYIFEGVSKTTSAEKMHFNIFKNNSHICELTLDNNKSENFLKEFLKSAGDYDFKECFNKHHSKKFSKEISEFINKCNSSIVLNGNLMEGYRDKMRMMAGITKNKEIR